MPTPKTSAIALATILVSRLFAFQVAEHDLSSLFVAPRAIPRTVWLVAFPIEWETEPHAVGVLRVDDWPWVMVPEIVATDDVAVLVPSVGAWAQHAHIGARATAMVEGVADAEIHTAGIELRGRLGGDDIPADPVDAIPFGAPSVLHHLIFQIPEDAGNICHVHIAQRERRVASGPVQIKAVRRPRRRHRRRRRWKGAFATARGGPWRCWRRRRQDLLRG
mmetsp:Transcript_14685/g.43635  ORF Transcript_14685/g.43635 Transcript_14685/m.43635 type:complete len:220 (+) Transcript_14685:285-944(+)